jgi:hypothetical protein
LPALPLLGIVDTGGPLLKKGLIIEAPFNFELCLSW